MSTWSEYMKLNNDALDAERQAAIAANAAERARGAVKDYLEKLAFEPKKKGLEPRDEEAGSTAHQLKCWPEYFSAIREGRKTFDIRRGTDRYYRAGDTIVLREWDAEKGYTGTLFTTKLIYAMRGGPFLPEDTWIIAWAPLHPEPSEKT